MTPHRVGFGDRFLQFFQIKNDFLTRCSKDRWRREAAEQSQEGQELITTETSSQLILKMISEDKIVDPTNMLMGNDDDTIFVWFHIACNTRRHKLWK